MSRNDWPVERVNGYFVEEAATRDAIRRSVQYDEIVHIQFCHEVLAELGLVAEDSIRNGDVFEFWGTTDAGDPWRVHMASAEEA